MTSLDSLLSISKAETFADAATGVDEFRQAQMKKFFETAWAGPLFVYYALRGKIGPVERGLLMLLGASIIYKNFQESNIAKIVAPVAQVALPAFNSIMQAEDIQEAIMDEDDFAGGMS